MSMNQPVDADHRSTSRPDPAILRLAVTNIEPEEAHPMDEKRHAPSIQLDDAIEAITAGMLRALHAQEEDAEVSGFQATSKLQPWIIAGGMMDLRSQFQMPQQDLPGQVGQQGMG